MKSMPKGQKCPMSLHGASACRVVTKACGQVLGSTLSTGTYSTPICCELQAPEKKTDKISDVRAPLTSVT